MKTKVLYALYDNEMEEILLITRDYSIIEDFLELRTRDISGYVIESRKRRYQIGEITDKDHIKQLEYLYTEGERYGKFVLTPSEFEWFSEYVAGLNSTLLYDLEVKIIDNLKYLKICDEDIESIVRAIKILMEKVSVIADGPQDDIDTESSVCDEENVYDMNKLVSMFMQEMILES